MRKFSIIYKIGLTVVAALISIQTSQAQSVQSQSARSLCSKLERPNIDCSCVANRMGEFQSVSSSSEVKTLLRERYAYALGFENDLDRAFQNYAKDPMQRVKTEIAFDKVGGMPENVTDFEEGCVITDARPAIFLMPSPGSTSAQYIDARVKRVGEYQRRNAICVVEKLSDALTDDELRAHTVHMTTEYNTGGHSVAAQKMGLSESAHRSLLKSSDQKRGKVEESIESYCSAMTYADEITPEQNQAALADQTELVNKAIEASGNGLFLTGDDTAKARQIMQYDCQSSGRSDSYCQCAMSDFETKVVQQAPRPSVALSWAVLQAGSRLPQDVFMDLNRSAKPKDHEDAVKMFTSTMDVAQSCREDIVPAQPMKGNPRTRMIAICMADNDNEALCECTTDKMRSKLSPDDFELIVDIREAEAQGSDDPLAKVAEDRGLTAQEAQEAMMTNQSLIGGVMAMDMMSCIGGMPSMPSALPFTIPNPR